MPKVAQTSHGHELRDVADGWSRFPLSSGDRFLAVIPFHFGFGRTGAQRGLLRGGTVVVTPPPDSAATLQSAVARHAVTWTLLTPTHLRQLLTAAPAVGRLLPGLRILVGTAPLRPAERQAVMRRISSELYLVYGTNEVGGMTVATPADLARNPEGVGRPAAGTELEVVDALGRPCPPAVVGTLRFRHPLYPQGYWLAAPGATSRFAQGWFYPGDAGLIDADGQLVLKGRVDDLINAGGLKIHPADIEDRLLRHPDVVEAVAVGIPDRLRGTVVAAAVVLRGPPVAAEALMAHCRAALGAPRSPVRIVALDALPRTAIGKVDRVALRRLLAGGAAADGRDA